MTYDALSRDEQTDSQHPQPVPAGECGGPPGPPDRPGGGERPGEDGRKAGDPGHPGGGGRQAVRGRRRHHHYQR